MMNPVHHAWSVIALPVREPSPAPALSPAAREKLRAELIDARTSGKAVKLDPSLALALLDASEPGRLVDYEAVIEDHERGVQYRARVDVRGDLSRLEVVIGPGWIDDNATRRVPIGRIRREALAHISQAKRDAVATGDPETFVLTLPGGLAERPTLEEVASLMTQGRTRREIHAMYSDVPLPTLGRWMTQIRKASAAVSATETPTASDRRETKKGKQA